MSNNPRKGRKPAIEIWKNMGHEWQFRLRAANGEIQGGGEGYKRRSGAIRGALAFQRNCALALIHVFDAAVSSHPEGAITVVSGG